MTNKNLSSLAVLTWGTESGRKSGIQDQAKRKSYGGNPGHAAIEMKIPADEYGEQLISQYCKDEAGDTLIPHHKETIRISPNSNETQDVFVVYFSGWPAAADDTIAMNTKADDLLSEWSGASFTKPGTQSTFDVELETRVYSGAKGTREITLGPKSISHNRQFSENSDEAKYIQVKQELHKLDLAKSSLNKLSSNLSDLNSQDTPISLGKKITQHLTNVLPGWEMGCQNPKLISTSELENIMENASKLERNYNNIIRAKTREKDDLINKIQSQPLNKQKEFSDSIKDLTISQKSEKLAELKKTDPETYYRHQFDEQTKQLHNLQKKESCLESLISPTNLHKMSVNPKDVFFPEIPNRQTANWQQYINLENEGITKDNFNVEKATQLVETIKQEIRNNSTEIKKYEKAVDHSKVRLDVHKQEHPLFTEKAEQVLTLGKPADEIIHLPVNQNQADSNPGLDPEKILKKMHEFATTKENFDLEKLNCSKMVSDVLTSGCQSNHKSILSDSDFGGIYTPQRVHYNCQKYENICTKQQGKLSLGQKLNTVSPAKSIRKLFGKQVINANKGKKSVGSKAASIAAASGIAIVGSPVLGVAKSGSLIANASNSIQSSASQLVSSRPKKSKVDKSTVEIKAPNPERAITLLKEALENDKNALPVFNSKTMKMVSQFLSEHKNANVDSKEHQLCNIYHESIQAIMGRQSELEKLDTPQTAPPLVEEDISRLSTDSLTDVDAFSIDELSEEVELSAESDTPEVTTTQEDDINTKELSPAEFASLKQEVELLNSVKNQMKEFCIAGISFGIEPSPELSEVLQKYLPEDWEIYQEDKTDPDTQEMLNNETLPEFNELLQEKQKAYDNALAQQNQSASITTQEPTASILDDSEPEKDVELNESMDPVKESKIEDSSSLELSGEPTLDEKTDQNNLEQAFESELNEEPQAMNSEELEALKQEIDQLESVKEEMSSFCKAGQMFGDEPSPELEAAFEKYFPDEWEEYQELDDKTDPEFTMLLNQNVLPSFEELLEEKTNSYEHGLTQQNAELSHSSLEVDSINAPEAEQIQPPKATDVAEAPSSPEDLMNLKQELEKLNSIKDQMKEFCIAGISFGIEPSPELSEVLQKYLPEDWEIYQEDKTDPDTQEMLNNETLPEFNELLEEKQQAYNNALSQPNQNSSITVQEPTASRLDDSELETDEELNEPMDAIKDSNIADSSSLELSDEPTLDEISAPDKTKQTIGSEVNDEPKIFNPEELETLKQEIDQLESVKEEMSSFCKAGQMFGDEPSPELAAAFEKYFPDEWEEYQQLDDKTDPEFTMLLNQDVLPSFGELLEEKTSSYEQGLKHQNSGIDTPTNTEVELNKNLDDWLANLEDYVASSLMEDQKPSALSKKETSIENFVDIISDTLDSKDLTNQLIKPMDTDELSKFLEEIGQLETVETDVRLNALNAKLNLAELVAIDNYDPEIKVPCDATHNESKILELATTLAEENNLSGLNDLFELNEFHEELPFGDDAYKLQSQEDKTKFCNIVNDSINRAELDSTLSMEDKIRSFTDSNFGQRNQEKSDLHSKLIDYMEQNNIPQKGLEDGLESMKNSTDNKLDKSLLSSFEKSVELMQKHKEQSPSKSTPDQEASPFSAAMPTPEAPKSSTKLK